MLSELNICIQFKRDRWQLAENYMCCHADLAVLAQMVPPPSTAAAAQNSVQNTLQNAPLGLQESPIRLLIAVTLVAVAVGGYLLREKAQKEK